MPVKFINMSMKLNWALDKEHAEKPELLDDEIIWVDILDFLNRVKPPYSLDPDNLSHGSKKRVAAAKKHFENGGWMDPCFVMGRYCDVYPQHPDDNLIIENRHRLIAALQLGETHAPVSVPNHLIKELKVLINFVIS